MCVFYIVVYFSIKSKWTFSPFVLHSLYITVYGDTCWHLTDGFCQDWRARVNPILCSPSLHPSFLFKCLPYKQILLLLKVGSKLSVSFYTHIACILQRPSWWQAALKSHMIKLEVGVSDKIWALCLSLYLPAYFTANLLNGGNDIIFFWVYV